MTDLERAQAHKAVWQWHQYFDEHGVDGAPAPLPALKVIVDYAVYLENESVRLMHELSDPYRISYAPSWWERFLHIIRLR